MRWKTAIASRPLPARVAVPVLGLVREARVLTVIGVRIIAGPVGARTGTGMVRGITTVVLAAPGAQDTVRDMARDMVPAAVGDARGVDCIAQHYEATLRKS